MTPKGDCGCGGTDPWDTATPIGGSSPFGVFGGPSTGGPIPRVVGREGGARPYEHPTRSAPLFLSTTTADGFETVLLEGSSPFDENRTYFGSWETLRWRGAPGSFVDVYFDTPPNEVRHGNLFIRYAWPPGDTSVRTYTPLADATARWPPESYTDSPTLGLLGTWGATAAAYYSRRGRPRQITALRYYDPGECAAVISWETLRAAFRDAIVDGVRAGGTQLDPLLAFLLAFPIGAPVSPFVDPISSVEVLSSRVEPLMRADGDVFRVQVYARLTLNPPVLSIYKLLWMDLAFESDGAQVAVRLRDGDGDLLGQREAIEEQATRLVYQLLAQVQTTGSGSPSLPCNTVQPDTPDPRDFRDRQASRCLDNLRAAALLPPMPPLSAAGMSTLALVQPWNAVCVEDPPNATRAGCGIAPNVVRTFVRPEGLQLVLSNRWAPDPLAPLLREAAPQFCGGARYGRFAFVGEVPYAVDVLRR